MNPFIKESHELIRGYFNEICNVTEADEYFGINEYSDLIVLTKPIVYMTVQEIAETHRVNFIIIIIYFYLLFGKIKPNI